MKKLSLAICYILISVFVFAQQTFTGRVTDAASALPVPGATIVFGSSGTVVSDAAGNFSLRLTPRSYQVTITSIGYRKLQVSTAFTADTAVFKLERYDLFLQPVEIRATRAGDKSPFTVTNLVRKDIEKNNLGQDLPFLLNQTPSVVINSDAGNGVGYTGLRIRGTDGTRINVTLNGIPYNDAESQGSFFVDMPDIASSVNSIQIQRGVGTSSNGAGAFGASINIGTNEFREDAYAEINNSYGSFNTRKNTLRAGTGLLKEHFTVDARISKVTSDGFIDRAASDLGSLYFSAAYLGKKSTFRFNLISGKEKTYQAWNGILQDNLRESRTYNSAGTEKPGTPYDNETDNYQQDHYQLFFNHEFNPSLSFNTAVFLSRGKGYYEQYKAGAKYTSYGLQPAIIGNDTLTTTDLVRQLWLDNYYFGNIFSLQYKKNNTQFTIGGGVNRYNGSHYGKVIWAEQAIPKDHEWYRLSAFKTDASVYAKLQQRLAAHWDVFGDLQYRHVDYDLNGFRDNPALLIKNKYNFVNPKLGIHYNRNALNAYFSYAVANKEPNRDDFEAGTDKQPDHETLHDVELGLSKSTKAYSWGVTGFYMYYRNQLVQTGKINDVGAYTRTNIPVSYRTGLELQGSLRLNAWINVNGNLTLSSNKVKNFSEFVDDYDNGGQKVYAYKKSDIAFSPGVTGSGSLALVPFKNSELSFISKYVGRQYLDNSSNASRSLADYYVQDLRLFYSLKGKAFKSIDFIGQVNNLFNRKYEPNGYTFSYVSGQALQTENYVFPMAGINWMIGFNINL